MFASIKLRTKPEVGIQGRQRTLRNQRDLFPSQPSHLTRAELQQVAVLKQNLSGAAAAPRLQQAQDGQGDGALSLTAAADQPHNLSLPDVERNLVQDSFVRVAH